MRFRVNHRAARFVRGRWRDCDTVDNPVSSPSFYPQGSTYPGRLSVQLYGATSVRVGVLLPSKLMGQR